MKVQLSAHDPEWGDIFELEKQLISSVFYEPGMQVEHIGSTAVTGLISKPVIDILIGLDDFNKANHIISILCDLGYTYKPEYEKTLPERRFLYKDLNGIRKFNLHMVEHGSIFYKRHIAFRNCLIHEEKTRKAYAELKYNLSLIEYTDGNEYANKKTVFIRKVESELKF